MAEETATIDAPAPGTDTPSNGPGVVPGEGSHSTTPSRLPDGRFGLRQYDAMDWRGSLSDEVRGNPDLTKTLDVYKDPNHFVRDAIQWRQEVNRRVRMPAQDAKPEEWQGFWKNLPGYPEKPQGYTDLVKLPELPTSAEGEPQRGWDERDLQTLYETAFAEGMTAKQTQAILDLYARREASAKNLYDAQLAEVEMQQQRERYTRFGASTKTEEAKAEAFFRRLTQDTEQGQRVAELLRNARLDDGRKVMNEPEVVEFFALATQRWAAEPEVIGLESSFSPIPTAAETQAALAQHAAIALDETKTAEQRLAARDAILAIHGRNGSRNGTR